MKIRQTLLRAYNECPRKYKYMTETPLTSTLMLEGTEAHKKIDKNNIPEHFTGAWGNFTNPQFEREFQVDLFGTTLTGTVDCMSISNDTLYLVDWKLNWCPEDDFQLKTYAWLVRDAYSYIATFVCYYCSINQTYYRKFTYTNDEISDFGEELLSLTTRIEEDSTFSPQPSSKCSQCLYVSDCFKQHFPTLQVSAIQSMDDFREIANKVYIAEGYIDNLKQQLKDYMLKHDITEEKLNGGRIYLSHTVSLRFGKDRKKGGKDE